MDKTHHTQPANDDQQFAQALEEGKKDKDQAAAPAGLQFEETGTFPAPVSDDSTTDDKPADTPAEPDTKALEDAVSQIGLPQPEAASAEPETPSVEIPASPTLPAPAAQGELDNLKKDALEELRPLVNKLELPADEKFDIMLLIIRSTDDQSLLVPAHDAAKNIEDDQKRAQALLDIIKEIDYFANQGH